MVDRPRHDHTDIAQYGNSLALLGDVSRAALCASEGMELKSGDFSAIERVVLAWLAGEYWKLDAYQTYQRTGDTKLEPYRVIARKMLHKPADAEISTAERQLGKGAELASGFGGSVGAWRRIMPHDPRTDGEIRAIIQHWRDAHPPSASSGRMSLAPSVWQFVPVNRSSWHHRRDHPSSPRSSAAISP